ncbi:hypothetical protein [Roseomonas indoligenes]|uniref:Uncharacterized protein n=1 Tax=Roseomonas indoligenes TaxID=2820811 RepID=A0A940MX54_9PROT|nr:hypothetical protein [Pararoseomonas indoligenes]MBP0493313.1 hypothetical protein [Pararoseomonas indoligenes]
MPTIPLQDARPAQPDPERLGPVEARRQSVLLATPGRTGGRYPGDGGRSLPVGGGLNLRHAGRQAPWRQEER